MDKPISALTSTGRPGTLFGGRSQAPAAATGLRPAWPFKVQARAADAPGRKMAETGHVRFTS